MLSIARENEEYQVKINFSSLDLINTCPRKAYYSLFRNLKQKDESEPLVFGKAVHAALEAWYVSPPETRHIPTKPTDKASLAINAGICEDKSFINTVNEKFITFASAFYNFGKAMRPLRNLDPTNKRSKENGIKIINNYFQKFLLP